MVTEAFTGTPDDAGDRVHHLVHEHPWVVAVPFTMLTGNEVDMDISWQ